MAKLLSIPYIANRLWLRSQRQQHKAFKDQLDTALPVQLKKLFGYLEAAKDTAYGKTHQFRDISTYEQYCERVPVIEEYSQLQPYIEQMKNGESDILFPGQPSFFEKTSGTTTAAKYIPYNDALKAEFQQAIAPWMHGLSLEYPKAMDGKAYWSLSPATNTPEQLESGIAVGTQDDSDYFSPLTAWLLDKVLAVPSQISRIRDPHAFYVITWQHLLQNRDLTFISVWSPYFLIRLVDFLKEHFSEIIDGLPMSQQVIITSFMKRKFTLKQLFPKLVVVSCWTQGQAGLWIGQLQQVLGNIAIQGKGLLSTEGVVTIPYAGSHLLAYTAHFYEFKDQSGKTFLLHELQQGNTYEVILTTAGGLYRYNTHDTVRCLGYEGQVPDLEFLGRSNQTSDLVGEKLSQLQVGQVFGAVQQQFPEIKALYLTTNTVNPGYHLIIEANATCNELKICKAVDTAFCTNPYYHQAIQLGQLTPLSSAMFAEGISRQIIQSYKEQKGIKDGDLKIPYLLNNDCLPKDVLAHV